MMNTRRDLSVKASRRAVAPATLPNAHFSSSQSRCLSVEVTLCELVQHRFKVDDSGFRVQELGLRLEGLGFEDLRFRI